MKKRALLFSLLLLLVAINANAFDSATATIRDGGFTNKFQYAIDIYIISDGFPDPPGFPEPRDLDPDFEVGTTRLTIAYNNSVLSNPVLSEQHPDFNDTPYIPMQLSPVATDRIQLQITPNGVTGTILPNTEIRLGRITFTIDDTAYTSQYAEIAWVSPLTGLTFIQDINDVDKALSVESDTIAGNNNLRCAIAISGTPEDPLVGDLYSFIPTVSCHTDQLRFELPVTLDWTEIDLDTGELSGTPQYLNLGTSADIRIDVTDDFDGSTATTGPFSLEVLCPPAPILSGTPVTSITAGSYYQFTPERSDGCGALTYEIDNPPTWADFDLDTGALTGTPESTDAGTTSGIVIRVFDQNDDSAELPSFDIEVTATSSGSSSSTSSSGGEDAAGAGGDGGGGGGGCFITTLR